MSQHTITFTKNTKKRYLARKSCCCSQFGGAQSKTRGPISVVIQCHWRREQDHTENQEAETKGMFFIYPLFLPKAITAPSRKPRNLIQFHLRNLIQSNHFPKPLDSDTLTGLNPHPSPSITSINPLDINARLWNLQLFISLESQILLKMQQPP